MYLQKNIKNLRKFKNLNQEQLAQAIGIKRSCIGSYEEGRAQPPIEVLIKLAKHFSITLDELVNKELLARKETVLFKDGEL